MAGVSLASARTVSDISTIIQRTVTAFIGRNSRHETLFAVRAGTSCGSCPRRPNAGDPAAPSGVAELAVTWLPQLRLLRSADPRVMPAAGMDPDVRTAATRAGL